MAPPTESGSSPSKIGLAAVFARIIFSALSRVPTYPFRSKRAPTLYKDVLFAAVRAILSHMTIPQHRYISPSTTQMYLKFCKAHKYEPKSLEVETPTGTVTAHWIGSPDAESVVLYFHGGGYTQPASEGYFHYFTRLVQELNNTSTSTQGNKPHRSIAILMLSYSLAPEAQYPTQLVEATAMLTKLLTLRPTSNIIISGDSAGGNLALSLLSHILHPYPDVPSIKLLSPLAGTMLYSPWVSFRTDHPSFTSNMQLDILPDDMLRRWAAMFLGKSHPGNPEADPGPISGTPYTEPNSNPAEWWSGMHRIVSHVFVWSGGDEGFRDQIREFEGVFREGWCGGGGDEERVLCVESRGEAHIGPIMDVMIKAKGERVSAHQVVIDEWHRARLEV